MLQPLDHPALAPVYGSDDQPRLDLALFGSKMRSKVGPLHFVNLGGPRQPLPIALPTKQKR
jgi:hypothetical protein